MPKLLALIPLLPLLGFVSIGLFGRKAGKPAVSCVAVGLVVLSFVLSAAAFRGLADAPGGRIAVEYAEWLSVGDLKVPFGLVFDPLSGLMALVVTGIGALIHLYSVGYMAHEEGYARYFAYLNLFVFFMLTLVLGSSLPLLFVGWEGVGLCSYLLIGYYFETEVASAAGLKAFLANRVGDLGMTIGMMALFAAFGTLTISDILAQAGRLSPEAGFGVLTFATLMLFLGATGKSAQIPLYVWLPDAMAGPTPVSALIHAATMVTAGIFMICRLAPLFQLAPITLTVVAWVGGATALFAATIGLLQRDIKKVLAYSTVSQLGYMFLGLGAGGFAAGFFHLFTHAWFKALLFLGAG
ncbi:MAG TPA: NADH-quinone oxidoreductase subunit L, partial [Holophaga sp.]|nr:NADH-quinone oxidoreductase subunit L [Holophaga sp.]HPS66297.1 NADH-quinone oxidoreductase subunit L [Holophaga sp.]